MYENRSYTIITTIEIGDEVYDKIDNLEVGGVLKRLVKELIKGIKQNLSKSDDIFFKYAYENAEILHDIVRFRPTKEGGSYRNGIIYVGELGFTSSDMGSDDDIMGTLFHEFMHYTAFKLDIYPTRYEDREGEQYVWSTLIRVEESLESEEEFYDTSYNSYLITMYPINSKKYENYPDFYKDLSEEQKKEVGQYIKEQNLKPKLINRNYQYIPSNLAKDEINAHKKTIEGHQLSVFIMSDAKLKFYNSEIERYTRLYNKHMEIEKEYGYTPEGYERN